MIVVTGGSGVLGRALLAELGSVAEPVEVLTSAACDLRDPGAVLAVFDALRPRLIYHLAARVHGLGGNQRFPAEMFIDNIRINTNVVDAAHRCGVAKIVAVSTVATYASNLPMPVAEAAIWTGPPHHLEAAYGHAKRAMLAQLEAYAAQYGLRFAYPILTNIYGPHDRFDVQHGHVIPSLIAKFYGAVHAGTPLQVWGTGRAERDFIYAEDAARALVLVAERHEGPINLATGHIAPIRAVVEQLQRHTGVTAVEWDATKPDGQLLRRYDVSHLRALGFEPRIDLATGLARTYDWYARSFPNVRTG